MPDEPVPALGLVMLSYPLHAAGRPERPCVEHFPSISVPVLFVSGTCDSLAGQADLVKASRAVKGRVTFHWVDTADHGYRPLKASGRNLADVCDEVARVAADWVAALPA